mmetsp:Transcript_10434/g.19521  ORF Transcript_10434/g.19521 Transcript_10434/m.19521 type:complete len:95 (+) Transcript_10434:4147-4431(+)
MLFVFLIALLSAVTTFFSLSESSAAVGSSSRRTSGFRIKALAIARRCLCPPESVLPPSPTRVSSSRPILFLSAPSTGSPATSNASITSLRHFGL